MYRPHLKAIARDAYKFAQAPLQTVDELVALGCPVDFDFYPQQVHRATLVTCKHWLCRHGRTVQRQRPGLSLGPATPAGEQNGRSLRSSTG